MRSSHLVLVVAIACVSSSAAAEEAGGAAPEDAPAPTGEASPAAEAAAETPTAAPSTVQGLAEEVVGQVGRLVADMPRARMDFALVLTADLPGPARGRAELAALLRRIVTGSLSRDHGLRSVRAMDVTAEGPWADEALARAAAADQGYELLLLATVEVEQNHLVVEGQLFVTERHIWQEAVEPERRLLGQVFARRRVNAEVRHYLGAAPGAGALTVRSVQLGRRGYLAMAVADLDGDDLAEIVLLRRNALEVQRLREEVVEMVATLPLTDLPRAATPSRDPVGSVVVGPAGGDGSRPVAFRTSDHRLGQVVRFDGAALRIEAEVEDYPIRWRGEELECATVRAGRSAFETEAAPCRALAAARSVPPYFGVDDELVPRPRDPPGVATAMVLADGRALLRWQGRPAGTIRSFGTAVAVTDVDDDGVAEVLLSSDRDPGDGDELTVVRVDPGGEDRGREPLGSMAGSVWVAAAGDADDDGLRELLAIAESGTGARLLVVE